jgi:ribosomal protein S18 acetylase RimI-like enzyme
MSEKIVKIEGFTTEIYNFVCLLVNQLVPKRYDLSEASFHAILNSENVHLFIIYNEYDIPIGMLTVGIYHTPSGKKAWVEDVVIDETFRGNGYGEKITKYAVDFISAMNVDTISLTTNPSRIAANQLYQKMGFEPYETNVYKMRLAKGL